MRVLYGFGDDFPRCDLVTIMGILERRQRPKRRDDEPFIRQGPTIEEIDRKKTEDPRRVR